MSRSWHVGEGSGGGGGGVLLHDPVTFRNLCGRRNGGHDCRRLSRKGALRHSWDESHDSILDYFSPRSYDAADVKWETSSEAEEGNLRGGSWELSEESVPDDFFSVRSYGVESETGDWSLNVLEDDDDLGRGRTRSSSTSSEDAVVSGNRASKGVVASDEYAAVSTSVGEDPSRYLRAARLSQYKGGSLTNIHDPSGRGQRHALRDSRGSSRSLSNLHDCLWSSITNLGNLGRDGFGSVRNIKDKLADRKGSRRQKGSWSSSNLTREGVSGSVSHWGSNPRIYGGKEALRRSMLDCSTWESPREASEILEEHETKKREGHGWEKLRGKVLEKRSQAGVDATGGEAFQEGGGEGESEWVHEGEKSLPKTAERRWERLVHKVLDTKGKGRTDRSFREADEGSDWMSGEENAPRKPSSSRGWDTLLQKVLQETRRLHTSSSSSRRMVKDGHADGGNLKAGVTDASPNRSPNRPPKFSEIFGGVEELRKVREQMKLMESPPVDARREEEEEEEKKKKKKKRKKRRSERRGGQDGAEGNEGAVGRWKYATSGAASLSCGANLNNFKLEVVADVEEERRDNPEDKTPSHEVSPESGLGSSFEDETPGSSSTSQASSNPPSPTAPRKVFDAITHYFRTVDLVDNEDGLDSFNREAEVIDPDDLMLLTDNEDAFTWHDLVLPCDERRQEPGHVQDGYQELQLNFSTGGDVNVWDNKVDLDQLLGGDYPSLEWDMPEATRSSSTQPGPAAEPADDLAGSIDTVVGQEDTSEIEGLQQPTLVPDQGLETTEDKERVEDEFNTSHETSSNSFDNVTSDDKERDESCTSLGDITSSFQTTSSEGAEEEVDNALALPPPPEAAAGADDAAAETRGRSRTREKPERQRSATSGERSVSCSDNIRAFLQSQPCAHAHQEGIEHPGCSDKHVLESSTSVETHHLPGGNVEAPTTKKTRKKTRRYPDSPRPPLRQYNSASRSNTSFWSRLFCTAPVTVEGLAPDLESHDTDPEPLPPPIPPHGVDPSSITEVQPSPTSQPEDPEVMTADEAQRLLSANILEGKVRESQSLLSDEEAQEVVLLLSPQEQDASKVAPPVPQHFSDTPPAVPPHYTEAAPPIPPHYTPGEDEYDTRVASHFDPSLTSPLSPEDEPSEADSSEASGDVYQVSRVKEVLVEDGVHYLEDGHFWVEVPGLPEEDEDDDNDPSMPYHPHTKLTFSKDPVQVFSTYSVTEYDRKNDEVDPVAASAEYELEKRVEKMDLFPVEIVKGEGGLGLSIIGMGVGADAGVEKLGIFVKTITQGGATERDGRIQVNDQIIEVDGKSLVGVTQVFAASVLKNTSGRVHFLIGREKDPENSEVALLIKQSLQADREREERRRALGGPDYDPHTGQSLFDPLSSPSEENSRSEDVSVQHNYSSYLEGGSSPTSPDATSPPPEVFDLEGDTSDTSPDNDVAVLKLKLKEVQYRNAVAEAEITKLKMSLLEMEKVVTENTKYTSQLLEAQNKMADLDTQLQSKLSEVSTYQDMLEQSQGQFIVLEKKYYKAKKIIKEYQGRERDFLHREEYHITQLEEKDSHYNALVKALKDRVIHLEAELTSAQKKAGLPIQVPSDTSTQPAYWNLQQNTQSALAKQPPRKPSLCTLDPEISDTETSDTGTSEGEKANTVERKIPVKEELDEAVPPHELLDVSASRAKGELASRGGLANRHLPSLKKTTSMSSASSQEQSLDDSSLDDDLPEAVKHPPVEAAQDGQQDQGSRRSAETQESPLPPHSPSHTTSSITYAKSPQPPSYTQATMGNVSHLGSPPPYLHPPGQFGSPRQPFTSSHVSSDPSSGLPTRPLGAGIDSQSHESRSESRPEIPYRHPPPVARVQPVNRAEISESTTLASHLANRTPQQQSLAEQLKALLAERELESDATQQRNDREASPSKRSPTSLMEDVRQAVMQADVTLGKKPVISAPVHLSSTAHVVSGQLVHQVSPPQRSQSSFYSTGGRESVRDSNAGSQSPRIGRGSLHASPGSGVSASPSGVVLLSQRPLDSSLPAHKLAPGVDGSSGDLSSGPASLGSGDEGSGASLGSQSSLSHTHPPTERTKRSHMWQTAPVVDWTKEQVSQWLVVQGLESCVGRFQDVGMTGPRLLNLDVRDLKALGLPTEEKTKLKRKVKELRIAVEKERKQAEKEKKEREKLQKKAEKLAEKAEKKKK
ncbi:uncharacterized protein Spn isoform X19 [Panulirus ornatus]|uniref:uncharacterized protein Spn isoform X19 n=1 Tax=Panulirus ornatus TaxID=150431 RepID=UPI003A8A9144